MRMQLERMEREVHSSLEQNSQLTGRLNKAEREVNALTCQVCCMLTSDLYYRISHS